MLENMGAGSFGSVVCCVDVDQFFAEIAGEDGEDCEYIRTHTHTRIHLYARAHRTKAYQDVVLDKHPVGDSVGDGHNKLLDRDRDRVIAVMALEWVTDICPFRRPPTTDHIISAAKTIMR